MQTPQPTAPNTRLWTLFADSSVGVDFGGQGYCRYHVTVHLDRFSVVTKADGVVGGSLQISMNEVVKDVCPNTPLGQRVLRFNVVDGQLTGDGGVVHFGADKTNEPQTTASFVAITGPSGFHGTLTITRTDGVTPVNWSAELPISLVTRLAAR